MSDIQLELLAALRDLYEPAEAERWLNEPQPLLSGRRPVDLLTSTQGRAEVWALVEGLVGGAFL